jgi:SAM-dependent methyltransferase
MKPVRKTTPYDKLASYYDFLFAAWGKDYQSEAEELRSIVKTYKKSPGNTLLDLGCGTGGHIEYLQNYYLTTGIDLSCEMLFLAKKKFPNIEFFHMDMSNFVIGRRFDIIVSLFSAIGYVCTWQNLCKVINSINNHLEPGGVVVIEPWFSPEEFQIHRDDVLFGEKDGIKACRMRESAVDNNKARIIEHILVSSNQQVTYLTSKHVFGLFTRHEFLTAFERVSLKVQFVEGGLTGRGLYIGTKPLK